MKLDSMEILHADSQVLNPMRTALDNKISDFGHNTIAIFIKTKEISLFAYYDRNEDLYLCLTPIN